MRWIFPMRCWILRQTFRKRSSTNSSGSARPAVRPNPCTDCNRYMKPDHLLLAGRKHTDWIMWSRGHYARAGPPFTTSRRSAGFGVRPAAGGDVCTRAKCAPSLSSSIFRMPASTTSQDICFCAGRRLRPLFMEEISPASTTRRAIDVGGRKVGTHSGAGGTPSASEGLGLAMGAHRSTSAPGYAGQHDRTASATVYLAGPDSFRLNLTSLSAPPPRQAAVSGRCRPGVSAHHYTGGEG